MIDDLWTYKKTIKRWSLRLAAAAFMVLALLMLILLNPAWSYANKTIYKSITIYHNHAVGKEILARLDAGITLSSSSEYYERNTTLDLCLNDGSDYPKLVEFIQGRAFGWGFYNKVVLSGDLNPRSNYVDLDSYKWNLTQLLSHEMIHCYQFKRLGLLGSNPLHIYPNGNGRDTQSI